MCYVSSPCNYNGCVIRFDTTTGDTTMIQTIKPKIYIAENQVYNVFSHNKKFYMVDNGKNRNEIDELTFLNLGGEIKEVER